MERIAIAGAGITGAYLHRLLRNRGIEVRLFDPGVQTRCGLTPCAWGTSGELCDLVAKAGLEPERYVQQRIPYLRMDGVKIDADIMTFDKPRLVQDLLAGVRPCREVPDPAEHDLLVDATGAARALLPPVTNDLKLPCAQFRVRAERMTESQVGPGDVGYAWWFPLGEGEAHVGCGSLRSDPRERLEALGWVGTAGECRGEAVVCGCAGEIRLTGPHGCLPFAVRDAETEVWGIGEAIGCVSPLAGDGIVPGMKSAQLLLERWGDPVGYTRAVLEEFAWMRREREILDKLVGGRRLSIRDALVLRRNARRMGMTLGLREAVLLLRAYRGS